MQVRLWYQGQIRADTCWNTGNFIKAAYPLSFTLSTMAWSAINFGQAFEQSGQAPYLDSTIRAGLDWLINAYPTDPEPSLYVVSLQLLQ